jgi:uncharacterized DUF497 family protein
MVTFEWDDKKAESNLRKHQIAFDEAVIVFGDGAALTFSDTDHSDNEDRSSHLRHFQRGKAFGRRPHGATQQRSHHQRSKGNTV